MASGFAGNHIFYFHVWRSDCNNLWCAASWSRVLGDKIVTLMDWLLSCFPTRISTNPRRGLTAEQNQRRRIRRRSRNWRPAGAQSRAAQPGAREEAKGALLCRTEIHGLASERPRSFARSRYEPLFGGNSPLTCASPTKRFERAEIM